MELTKGLTLKIDWQYGAYTGHINHYCGQGYWPSDDQEFFNSQAYWWFDGNGGCDCNRYGMVLEESGQFPWEPESDCGDEIIFTNVEFWRDGRMLGYGRDDMVSYDAQFIKSSVSIPTF